MSGSSRSPRSAQRHGRSGESETTDTLSAVHATAAHGFLDGELYERGRPSYPVGALEPLHLTGSTRVLDLGCGTGKLTRLLTTTGADVIGVDPLESMTTAFRNQRPDLNIVAATAESLPFRSSLFDVVTCASSFHWFANDRAVGEIHRVLGPGGRLGIVWNRRDRIDGWAAEFWAITEAHRRDTPGYRTGAWRRALEASGRFGPIFEHRFENVQRLDLDGMLTRVRSISFIETLPADERQDVLQRVERFIATHPETKDLELFELPYRTVMYVTSRVD